MCITSFFEIIEFEKFSQKEQKANIDFHSIEKLPPKENSYN